MDIERYLEDFSMRSRVVYITLHDFVEVANEIKRLNYDAYRDILFYTFYKNKDESTQPFDNKIHGNIDIQDAINIIKKSVNKNILEDSLEILYHSIKRSIFKTQFVSHMSSSFSTFNI